jgi:hypothetical protein
VVNKVTPNTTLTKAGYAAVRVSGAQGQRLAVAYAQANDDNNSADTIGLVTETIATNQEGFIMTVGQLEGINTTGSLQGETWVDGSVLYLSPTIPGALTNIKPNGSTGHIVVMGYVEYAHAINGKIYVKIMNGWELDELHNVYINPATIANNNILQYDSADQLWKNQVLNSGITIGTTAITSGTVGRVLFEGTGNVVQESANLFWDNTNGRLGIGTSTPSAIIHSVGSVTASGAIARANFFNNTLVAAANNDALVGLDIQPTFTNGAFTGVENIPLRFVSQVNSTVVKSILLKNTGSGAGSGVSIGFNNINTNNLSNAFIKSYYVVPSGMAMSFGTGGGSSLTSEGTTALVLNADQTANFTARVIANSGGFQATGVSANLLMSDNGTPVITRNGSTGIQFLKDAYWQTFSIFTNNTENLRVASTGNVLINTTTDAGFRLDVNGTARFTGQFSSGASSNFQICQNSGNVNFQVRADGYVQFNNYTPLSGGTMNVLDGSRISMFGGGPLSGNINQFSMSHLFQTNVSSHTYTGVLISTTINQTGGANGITRGLYINPTLTSAADFRAIETTAGRVIFGGLPTSSAGLPTGAIWNDAGTLKIV